MSFPPWKTEAVSGRKRPLLDPDGFKTQGHATTTALLWALRAEEAQKRETLRKLDAQIQLKIARFAKINAEADMM